MHRFATNHAVRRLRLAAFLLAIKCLLTPAAALVILYSLATHNPGLIWVGLAMLGLAGLVVMFQWQIAARTHCPLCMTPILGVKQCSKHRNARSLLGSHRLWVAVQVIFIGRFRCPYCDEPSVLEVRERHSGE
jgi:hypothetical protein